MAAAGGGKAPSPVGPSIWERVPYHQEIYSGYISVNSIFWNCIEWLNTSYGGKFFWTTLAWTKTIAGAKTWFVSVPEATYKLARHYEQSGSRAAHYLRQFSFALKPLHIMAPCVKSWLPIVEMFAKFPGIFTPAPTERKYVVVEENAKLRPESYRLTTWQRGLEKAESFGLWTLSLCASEASYHKTMNSGHPYLSRVASLVSPFISLKTLYVEGGFLWKMWQERGKEYPVKGNDKAKVKGTVAQQEVCGSALKISFAVMCLGLDLYNKFGPKEKQPVWLETTVFWTTIGSTFIAPAATYYWPELVTGPLYKDATKVV